MVGINKINALKNVFDWPHEPRWAERFELFLKYEKDEIKEKDNIIDILFSDMEETRLLVEKFPVWNSKFGVDVISDVHHQDSDDDLAYYNQHQGLGLAKYAIINRESWQNKKILVLGSSHACVPSLYMYSLGMDVTTGNREPLISHQIALSAILNNMACKITNTWEGEYDVYTSGPTWDGPDAKDRMQFMQKKANDGKEVVVNSPSIWLDENPSNIIFQNKQLLLDSKFNPHASPAYTFKVLPE